MRYAILGLALLANIVLAQDQAPIDTVISAATTVKGQIAALQQQLVAAQAEIASLTADKAALTAQVTTLLKDNAAANAQVTALTAQVATLQAEIVTLRARIAELEAKLPPPPPPTDTSVLSLASAALQAGQWGKLPISESMRLAINNEVGASGTLIGFAENMDWDEATKSLYFLGSDHTGKAKFVTYRAATDSWHKEPDAPWYANWVLNGPGMPAADHGYRHQVVEPGVAFYRRPQGVDPARRTFWRYDFATKAWAQIPPYPRTVIDYLSVAIGLAYFPERKSIVIVSSGAPYNVAEFEIPTQTWRGLYSMPKLVGSYHNTIQYNPVHKVMLIAGGVGNPRVLHRLDAAGNTIRLKDAPAEIELGVNRAIITVDPVSGDFLVLYGTSFYSYDIVTDAWRVLPSPPTRLPHPNSTSFGAVAAPVSTYGVTVWPACLRVKGACTLHIYKHQKGAGTPYIPPPPVVVLPAATPVTLPATTQTFAERCAQPGVVRCQGFDATVPLDIATGAGNTIQGAIDTAIKASGAGSLRFTTLTNTGPNSSGSYQMNFSNDLLTQFGEGEEFYVQWRQRFSPEMLQNQSGGGWKTIIIGEGDRVGAGPVYSCTQLEVVMNNGGWARLGPHWYHSCGAKDGGYEGIYEWVSTTTATQGYYPQNTIRDCISIAWAKPPCYGFQSNAWMTFQIRIKIGNWYLNDRRYWKNSGIEFWVANEGQRSVKIHSVLNYDFANNNPAAKYGKLWLLNYNTGKDATFAHPTAYTWYDDLIVSRNPIADPS